MNNNCTLKQCACNAKSRLLQNRALPTIVGKIPYYKYDKFLKLCESYDTAVKICKLIENETEIINPLSHIIDKEVFDALTPTEQQRYVFRLAEAYAYVKSLYSEVKLSC